MTPTYSVAINSINSGIKRIPKIVLARSTFNLNGVIRASLANKTIQATHESPSQWPECDCKKCDCYGVEDGFHGSLNLVMRAALAAVDCLICTYATQFKAFSLTDQDNLSRSASWVVRLKLLAITIYSCAYCINKSPLKTVQLPTIFSLNSLFYKDYLTAQN